jgi:hypothetical protein
MASRKTASTIAAKLRDREERLIRACEIANNDADVLAIEQGWDEFRDKADRVEEPWKNG